MLHFKVLNGKQIVMSTIIISCLTIFCMAGSSMVNSVIETNSANRKLPIYSVETDKKQVALTFDCAWGADDINQIIDTLNEYDVKATFFAVGDWIRKYPEAVQSLYANGMEIGNHSDRHAHVSKMSYGENLEDMSKCNDKIKMLTGDEIKYYRGPYGEYSNTVIDVAEELGMKVIQWDVDTLDYSGKTPDEMCDRIKKKIRNGSIILMHNDTKYTASGLDQIINCIEDLGYEIVPLDELVYENNYEINHEGRQYAGD